MAYRSMVCTHFSVHVSFYCQGLTLVCRCFQLTGAWLPAAGTPLLQGRPGRGNHLMIGPAAMVAWYGGTNRSHSKGNGPNTSLTQAQPRTPRGVLRGERPKRFFPPFLIGEKWGPAERPHRGRRSALEKSEKDRPSVCLMAETCPPAGSASPGWQAETRKTIEGQTLFPKREEKGLLQAQPATAPKRA